jgi:predicted extracellular nuclease
MKRLSNLIWILIILLISSCNGSEDIQSAQFKEIPVQILISEVFSGVDGNNQADFVELYNAGTEIADLQGYTLYYQLNDSNAEIVLYQWTEKTLVPPLGYYALIQEGQLFPLQPDGNFNQPLVPGRGGLSLRKDGQSIDQLCWGSGPTSMIEGHPAPEMQPGLSLQRSPEALASGRGDTDDNGVDFGLNSSPSLMNTGSPNNHDLADLLNLEVNFPYQVNPGEEFEVEFQIHNLTGMELNNNLLTIPLPEYLSLQDIDGQFQQDGDLIMIRIASIEDGESYLGTIPLRADFTFSGYTFRNIYLESGNWILPAFAAPFYGEIGGTAIPISTARELIDREVVVEGISTMYVGGFYAGSGAKFYLEDDSGGVQVYVSDAGNSLVVPLGSRVRVRGKIEVYRESIELIPSSQDQVEILEPGNQNSLQTPERIDLKAINSDPEYFPGRLIEVEGQVARVEEFSYSYEIDLFDESGNLVTLYVDKETGISIEEVEPEQFFRITGIMEVLDGNLRLYPRLQSDLDRVYPPGLYIQAQPPTTANPGESFSVVYSVINHGGNADTNLVIQAALDPNLEPVEIMNNGRIEGQNLIWEIPQLAGSGESIDLEFLARLSSGADYVSFGNYQVISDNYPDPATGIESYTFSGESVPIWAIQGKETRSPYVLSSISTEGVVTGVFPDLDGFWIQELVSDNDPSTSPGIFISTGPNLPDIAPGDLVSVTGRVREAFQQTQLDLYSSSDVVVLGTRFIPVPTALDPPANDVDSQAYYETLEGSLVSVPGSALVVGPTTRYGEYAVVLSKHNLDRVWQGQDQGILIHVDDGSSETFETRDDQDVAMAVGDTVSGLVGVLSYSYGNYKIQPTVNYAVQNQIPQITPLDTLEPGHFSVMTWNVENLFDFVVPHPSSPPLPKVREYKISISRVAQTIRAAGFPTVIGIQEVENLEILEDIAADPLLAEYDYQAALIEGTDSRGIDVGFLVRGDQAVISDIEQYPAPGNITSRPPLMIKVALKGSDAKLYFLNNHFTSMSGGEEATEPRRNAQAAWNAEIAQELLLNDPGALLVVMGDLNSFYKSLPLQTLEDNGLINLYDWLEEEERYSYVYQGSSQVLDHILVNPELEAYLVEVNVLHCNADYPLPLSDDEGFIHKSDHDPVIGVFLVP